MVGCLPVSVWTGSDFGVCSPIRSTGSGGCVVGGLMVGAGPAGGLLEFRGFGVVGGWCLRVGWRLCGLDWFSAPVLGFGS